MTSLTDDIFTFLNERGIPLEVLSFSGTERISGDFAYSIELRGSPDVEVSDIERSLLGRRAVLGLGGTTPLAELLAPKPLISPLLDKKGRAWDGTIEREVHGVVLGVRMTSAKNRSHLVVELGPRLSMLRFRRRSRIFQGQSLLETVKQVLDEWHLRYRVEASGTYARKAYTTQYQETDFDFVTRLLSEAGLLFWFDQPGTGKVEDEEELVLSDDATFYPKLPRGDAISFWNGHMEAKESELMELAVVRSFRPKVSYVGDFDFRKPALPLRAASKAEVSTKPSGELIESFEWYTHDAGVEDELGGGVEVNERLAARRVEQLRRDATLAEGLTKSRKMAPGYAFDLDEHPLDGMNTRWVVVSVEQRGRVPEKSQDDEVFQAKIVLAPAEVTVRPAPARDARAAGDRDGDRGGPSRRRDLHRRARAGEGAVSLGSRRQARRAQLGLAARRAGLDGRALWLAVHPAHRHRGGGHLPRRRRRPAARHGLGLQRHPPAAVRPARAEDAQRPEDGLEPRQRGAQRALVRRRRGARAGLPARAARLRPGGQARPHGASRAQRGADRARHPHRDDRWSSNDYGLGDQERDHRARSVDQRGRQRRDVGGQQRADQHHPAASSSASRAG
jgi:Rhs element Vgr protein